MDGPKISVSRMPALMPRRAKERARLTMHHGLVSSVKIGHGVNFQGKMCLHRSQ